VRAEVQHKPTGRAFGWAGLVAFLAMAGCDNGLAPELPDDYQPLVGDVVYACGNWSGAAFLQDTTVLVDVHVAPLVWSWHDQPPAQSQIDSVTAHGAQVVHVFPFPAMRVRVQAADLPAVMRASGEALATAVPDSTRFDWRFVVGYRDVFTTGDSLRLVELHGRVVSVIAWVPAAVVDLPEASFDPIRNHVRRVLWIDQQSWGCLDAAAAPLYTRSSTIAAP